jgi:hypothetical protein
MWAGDPHLPPSYPHLPPSYPVFHLSTSSVPCSALISNVEQNYKGLRCLFVVVRCCDGEALWAACYHVWHSTNAWQVACICVEVMDMICQYQSNREHTQCVFIVFIGTLSSVQLSKRRRAHAMCIYLHPDCRGTWTGTPSVLTYDSGRGRWKRGSVM